MKNRIVTLTLLTLLFGVPAASAQPRVTGVPLKAPAQAVLMEVMDEADVRTVRVTSTERTAAEQAEVMYNYILRNSVQNAYRLYGPEGDSIIAVFERTREQGRDAAVDAMTEETRRQLPRAHANNRLMHTKDTHYVFDVALSSIPSERRQAFIRAARAHPHTTRVLGPADGEQEAVHLEVPKHLRNEGRD